MTAHLDNAASGDRDHHEGSVATKPLTKEQIERARHELTQDQSLLLERGETASATPIIDAICDMALQAADAASVRLAALEDAARICEQEWRKDTSNLDFARYYSDRCASAIRAAKLNEVSCPEFPDNSRAANALPKLVEALRACIREMDRATIFNGNSRPFDSASALLRELGEVSGKAQDSTGAK